MSGGPSVTCAPAAPPLPAGDTALSEREFELFRRLIYTRTGIALGPQKRPLLRARLHGRLRALGIASFGEYYRYLTDGAQPGEMTTFINAITTNKTDFFREPHHFSFLSERWAPARRAATVSGESRRIRIWSAACSTGEEAYTLAMVLSEARLVPPLFDMRILASDIDTQVLRHASEGIYARERVAPIPVPLLRRYFLRSTAEPTQLRVRPELRQLVTFRQINLADAHWPIRAHFDVIFCRNALIYFDRPGQRAVLQRLLAVLKPDGLLFLGHAESVFGLEEGLVHLGNTIYTRSSGGAVGRRA
jgi:chemotaxis protein methyltransferase CheR